MTNDHEDKSAPSFDLSSRVAIAGLVMALALALALRLYGINWDEGFGWTPHPDERAILFRVIELSAPPIGDLSVLLNADESPWNPRWFPYGSFPLYLMKFADFIIERIPGVATDDLRVPARALSALADVATIALAYALGAMIWSRRTALLAANLVAVAVIHVQLSHFFAVDTLMALLCVATMFFLVRVARHGLLRDSALAGLFLGLGLATKVSVAPILAAYFVAHFIYAFGLLDREDGPGRLFTDRALGSLKNAVIGAAVIVGAFALAQPYAILDWSRFSSDVIEQSEMVRRIRDYPYTRQYVDTAPYLYHVQQLAAWGLGWPLGIIAWAGTIWAAVRGLSRTWAVGYLIVGVCLPAAILTLSASLPAIVLAMVIAVGALIASLPIRERDTRVTALLLSWVIPYFLITGAFDVKFMRYLIPITPFLILFGARMMIEIWDRMWRIGGSAGKIARAAAMTIAAAAVGATAFYAVAYLGIYTAPHPAVQAAEWMEENAPRESVILREHWDEGLPLGYGANWQELPLYEEDRPEKITMVSARLESGDYLVLYSNRLYGTISRLPERYPATREYYKLLFDGDLGYRLAAQFNSYPNLMGVGFSEDTFGRPDLPTPAGLESYKPQPVWLELGYADESFSVYDHPKILIFRNESRLDSGVIYERIAAGGFPNERPGASPSEPEPSESVKTLMLSPSQAEARQSGGTWTDIINPKRHSGAMSVIVWLIVVEGMALLAFPLAFVVFGSLTDRGWLFAKGLGLLLVGLVAWLLASAEFMAFTRSAVSVGAVALFIASGAVVLAKAREIRDFLRDNWKTIAVAELIFLAAFFAFMVIRMANPDLWHPARGGEKPMDMAYLNAVLKSSYMPPYDPWFGGGYINYYYWGQFLVATLVHATGITTEVAVNLAIPTFFAMTAAFSYSIVYNLASAANGGRSRFGAVSPIIAGLAGAAFVVVLGNLDGAIQLGQGAWRAVVEGVPAGEFDFWRSSRMMPPDPPGLEITEFPFFTFLFADPHAHLWALPFTVLSVGLCAAVVLGMARAGRAGASAWSVEQLLRIAVLGVAVGALRLLNTWDYPTYLLLAAGAVALGERLARGGFSLTMLLSAGLKSLLVFVVGYLVFLPYHLSNETFFNSVERTTNTTALWQFLAIHGLFIFVIASFYLWESRKALARGAASVRPAFDSLTAALSGDERSPRSAALRLPSVGTLLAWLVGILLAGYLLTALLSGFSWSVALLVSALICLITLTTLRAIDRQDEGAPATAFASLAVGAGLAVVVGLDFVRVEGDIERMNSVFKFYTQVWTLLALGAAYMVWKLYRSAAFSNWKRGGFRLAWSMALVALLLCAAVYPALGTRDRLRDRFEANVTPLTLDGLAYMEGSVYRDSGGPIDLDADFEGIEWMREKVQGSPVIVEANTPTYRWGGRVSIHTGLPSVVGWQWHQEQQRWGHREDVSKRIEDVRRIYSTSNVAEAVELLDMYDARYVYVGQVERLYYPEAGLAKFDGEMSAYLEPVFKSDQVSIYRTLN